MSLYRINPEWIERQRRTLADTGRMNLICHNIKSLQAAISVCLEQNIAYKIYNLGAGIKRITTDTETCPCCKQPLKKVSKP